MSKTMTSGQIPQLAGALAAATPTDLSVEDAQYWIDNRAELRELIARVLRERGVVKVEPTDDPNVFEITIDYDKGFDGLVKDGKYDWVSDYAKSQNFPLGEGKTGIHKVKVRLVHFGRDMSDEEVVEHFARNNLRRPDPEHLLAFGAAYPELQRQFPIVAMLKKLWRGPGGGRRVLCLRRDGGERGLRVGWLGGGWGGVCRFLAVCE